MLSSLQTYDHLQDTKDKVNSILRNLTNLIEHGNKNALKSSYTPQRLVKQLREAALLASKLEGNTF